MNNLIYHNYCQIIVKPSDSHTVQIFDWLDLNLRFCSGSQTGRLQHRQSSHRYHNWNSRLNWDSIDILKLNRSAYSYLGLKHLKTGFSIWRIGLHTRYAYKVWGENDSNAFKNSCTNIYHYLLKWIQSRYLQTILIMKTLC